MLWRRPPVGVNPIVGSGPRSRMSHRARDTANKWPRARERVNPAARVRGTHCVVPHRAISRVRGSTSRPRTGIRSSQHGTPLLLHFLDAESRARSPPPPHALHGERRGHRSLLSSGATLTRVPRSPAGRRSRPVSAQLRTRSWPALVADHRGATDGLGSRRRLPCPPARSTCIYLSISGWAGGGSGRVAVLVSDTSIRGVCVCHAPNRRRARPGAGSVK